MKRGTYGILAVVAVTIVGSNVIAASRGTQSLRNELRTQSFPQVKLRTAPAAVRVTNPEDAVVAAENMTDLEIPMKSEELAGSVNVVSAQPVSQTVEIQTLTQPTTLVVDSPVVDSRAERMRKRRQIIEEQTEQKMVERLEAERVKAEEARAEKIMKSLDSSDAPRLEPAPVDNSTSQNIQTVVTPTATVTAVESPAIVSQPTVISTAPTVINPPVSSSSIEDLDGSSSASLDVTEAEPKNDGTQYFFGVAGGITEYPSLDYAKGVYSLGVTGGVRLTDGFIFEGTFLYSSFDLLNQPTVLFPASSTIQMDSMSFLVNLKYQLLKTTRIRPFAGVAAAYVYRDFTESNLFQRLQTRTSNALDAGFVGGFDVVITDSFQVGLDLRYMFNVTNRSDITNNTRGNVALQWNSIENYSYYTAGILGKFTF